MILSILMNAFCYPSVYIRRNRQINEDIDTKETLATAETINEFTQTSNQPTFLNTTVATTPNTDDDDFDDDCDKPASTHGGGGSNIFSLLNLANALLPSLSISNNVKKNNEVIRKAIKSIVKRYQKRVAQNRKDVKDNVIEIDYVSKLTPPFYQRQESEETNESDSKASESNSGEDNGGEESVENNNGGEESVEEANNEKSGSKSEQDSASTASNGDDNDSDYDEPEGDGEGGGILGVLAGLSGDGDSDLGSLLAAVGGIVANLSGDGVDINAIIATGFGLFVGLLSDEGTNPGEVIASYLLTSLDTITGGGAENNGAFFGKFLSSLVKGASAGEASESNSEESGEGGTPQMADSAGFFVSLLMGLLGDMSKHSSSSSWR